MTKTAVMWIRDGVLIDRMQINAVAFACAVWLSSPSTKQGTTTLESLISFAFEKSGLSCAEKISLYNFECENISTNAEEAVHRYNLIASEAAKEANYFADTIELLKDLKSSGIDNFITSALDQEILDTWFSGPQGRQIADFMKSVLGKRGDFTKGRAHFQHVSELGYGKIYYIADAVFEISTGKKCASEFNLIPVGFGNGITIDSIVEAAKRIDAAIVRCSSEPTQSAPDSAPWQSTLDGNLSNQLDFSRIKLEDPQTNLKLLHAAGAEVVIEGEKCTLMLNLRKYFEKENLLGIPGPH